MLEGKIRRDGKDVAQEPEVMKRLEDIIRKWTFARQLRYNFEVQWQEAAQLLWPEWANTFFFGYNQWPGQKKTQQQVDSAGMLALSRFSAIMDSILTPFNDPWSRFEPTDKALLKSRRVRKYFDQLTSCLWDARYTWTANFQTQNQQNMQSLGAFGNMTMYVDELDTRITGGRQGLRYRSISPGEMYYIQNHQGQIDSCFRAFKRTARQIQQQWPDTFPATLVTALEQGTQTMYWIIQYVYPRTDWQPWRVDSKGMRWASEYISLEGQVMLEESGYRSWPFPTGRYTQTIDEVYGRGPAQQVLPTLKTANAQKVVYLKQGHRAGDPVYLIRDDDIDFKAEPGSYAYGAISKDGKPLVQALEPGNINITQEMMLEEQNIIKDAFLVKLFQLAWENPNSVQKSAREVVEFINDRGMLMAPTAGRQHSEYLGPLIHRELDLLAWQGRLPELPPELREAKNEYSLRYTNPISRALRASKAAALMRSVEMSGTIAQQSGNDEIFDIYDFETAIPAIGADDGIPEDWLASPQKLAQRKKARQDAQQQDAQIKAMPAQAAIIKAKAISDKAGAGQSTSGTLSGTALGQNPQIPGNPQGTPGQPGINGQPGQPGLPPPQGAT